MTADENLLVTIMEECGEIQQAVAKAMRFGMDNHHPDFGGEDPLGLNWFQIQVEFAHLLVLKTYAENKGLLKIIPSDELERIKMSKISSYKEWEYYSREMGLIT